jgi:hypothetical protein
MSEWGLSQAAAPLAANVLRAARDDHLGVHHYDRSVLALSPTTGDAEYAPLAFPRRPRRRRVRVSLADGNPDHRRAPRLARAPIVRKGIDRAARLVVGRQRSLR